MKSQTLSRERLNLTPRERAALRRRYLWPLASALLAAIFVLWGCAIWLVNWKCAALGGLLLLPMGIAFVVGSDPGV